MGDGPIPSGGAVKAVRLACCLTFLLAFFALTCTTSLAQTAHFSGAVRTLAGGFNTPLGIALDKDGNIFVADGLHSAVKEIVAVNGSIPANPTIKILGSGFIEPRGIAADAVNHVCRRG
jgi:hypothetical protein